MHSAVVAQPSDARRRRWDVDTLYAEVWGWGLTETFRGSGEREAVRVRPNRDTGSCDVPRHAAAAHQCSNLEEKRENKMESLFVVGVRRQKVVCMTGCSSARTRLLRVGVENRIAGTRLLLCCAEKLSSGRMAWGGVAVSCGGMRLKAGNFSENPIDGCAPASKPRNRTRDQGWFVDHLPSLSVPIV